MSLERDAFRTVGEWITEGAPDHAIPEDPTGKHPHQP